MTQIWYFIAINQSIIDSLSVPSFETYMPNSDRVVDKYLRRLPPEETLVAQLDLSDLWKWPSGRFNKIHILQEIGTCTRSLQGIVSTKRKEKKVMRHFWEIKLDAEQIDIRKLLLKPCNADQLSSPQHMPCFCKWFTIRLTIASQHELNCLVLNSLVTQIQENEDMCVVRNNQKYYLLCEHNNNVCFLVHSVHVVTLSNLALWYLYQYLIAAHNHQVINVEFMTSLWDMRSCTMISMKCALLVMMVSTAGFSGTWDSLYTRY